MRNIEEIYKIVGENIRIARNLKGLTQLELGQLINKPRSGIAMIENGQSRFYLHDYLNLKEVLGDISEDMNFCMSCLKVSQSSEFTKLSKFKEEIYLCENCMKDIKILENEGMNVNDACNLLERINNNIKKFK